MLIIIDVGANILRFLSIFKSNSKFHNVLKFQYNFYFLRTVHKKNSN